MKRFLILAISLFANVCLLHPQENFFPKHDGEKKSYSITVKYKAMELQGILVVKQVEQSLRCTLVNQFGIKAFDFEYNIDKKRGKVSNAISFLDKWYIRRTIKRDLKKIFKNMDSLPVRDSAVDLSNLRLTIDYTIKPL